MTWKKMRRADFFFFFVISQDARRNLILWSVC